MTTYITILNVLAHLVEETDEFIEQETLSFKRVEDDAEFYIREENETWCSTEEHLVAFERKMNEKYNLSNIEFGFVHFDNNSFTVGIVCSENTRKGVEDYTTLNFEKIWTVE